MKLTLGQIAESIEAKGMFDPLVEALGYSIDSRSISDGDLFFAIRGKKFDGHSYVVEALSNGAVAAVVRMDWQKPESVSERRLLRLPCADRDCIMLAMQQLAGKVRRSWGGRVIGVTGSAGKTTTKELIAMVLSTRFKVLKSEGNLNNSIGLPLQLLRLEPQHDIAVLEMGMNHPGEIRTLGEIAEPNWAVVTNVAEVHVEHFSEGLKGIARAKYELVESLSSGGIAILNADDSRGREFCRGTKQRAIFYGTSGVADVRAVKIEDMGLKGTKFVVQSQGLCQPVRLQVLGRHNVLNALASIAVGLRSGLILKSCCDVLEKAIPTEKRGNVSEWRGAKVINDCYNSNPAALMSMISLLAKINARRRILVVGEMMELGIRSAVLHARCGEAAANLGITLVLGVGGHAQEVVKSAVAKGISAEFVETPEQAGQWLKKRLQKGDVVLLKASRSVHLERALDELRPE
jgi:UDP-N-acetylmuramoyl-tripeptide--D-alanyl-D-alanine ligase